jgi:cyclopropane fatty-acyl-phospholipid synthase-like methyltransferase
MGAEVRPTPVGGWGDDDQVDWYLGRIGRLEARQAGKRVLADVLPPAPQSVLGLGCGDGRLAALALAERPDIERVVAVDRSAPMLAHARERLGDDRRVEVRSWDLGTPITSLGTFDLVVSGFAIHHLEHARKRALFAEITTQLTPSGAFLNLEVVASATPRRHAEFLDAIGRTADDPEDRLASVEDQLAWMRAAGMTDVDCLWRWRGFALLAGESAAATTVSPVGR